jgi:hypothetical protein
LQAQGVDVSMASPPLEDAAALANQRQNLRELLARADIGLSGSSDLHRKRQKNRLEKLRFLSRHQMHPVGEVL